MRRTSGHRRGFWREEWKRGKVDLREEGIREDGMSTKVAGMLVVRLQAYEQERRV